MKTDEVEEQRAHDFYFESLNWQIELFSLGSKLDEAEVYSNIDTIDSLIDEVINLKETKGAIAVTQEEHDVKNILEEASDLLIDYAESRKEFTENKDYYQVIQKGNNLNSAKMDYLQKSTEIGEYIDKIEK